MASDRDASENPTPRRTCPLATTFWRARAGPFAPATWDVLGLVTAATARMGGQRSSALTKFRDLANEPLCATGRSLKSPPRRLFGMLRHRVNASNADQAPDGQQYASWPTSLRRATESSQPHVITTLA
jgi:hypothetical protein